MDGVAADGSGARGRAGDSGGVDGAVVDGTLVDGTGVGGAVVDGTLVGGAVVDGTLVDGAGFFKAGVCSQTNVNRAMGNETTSQYSVKKSNCGWRSLRHL